MCTREGTREITTSKGVRIMGWVKRGRLGNREAHVLRGKSGLHSTGMVDNIHSG